jgi:hypothetical protein
MGMYLTGVHLMSVYLTGVLPILREEVQAFLLRLLPQE